MPFEIFTKFLNDLGVELKSDETDGIFEISVDENIDEGTAEKIEAEYDRLMALNHELFFAENPQSQENFRMASVMLTLKNGDLTAAHIQPDLLGRVLEVIDESQFNEIVKAMVTAVENPDDHCYIQKVRAGEVDFGADK